MTQQCVICTRDNRDGYACGTCTAKLVEDLYWLAWLGTELQVTVTKQARLSVGLGGPRTGSPLGYHAGAVDVYDALHNCLVGWVRDRGGPNWPRNTATAMALWLAHERAWLRSVPQVEQIALDVERHTNAALAVINPPPTNEQTYGVCGEESGEGHACEALLYGEVGDSWVRCRRCGTQHDTRTRREALERRMEGLYFRAATLARLLPLLLERPVSASNIRNWRSDGRPIRTGLDSDGWITYRCGDVIEVARVTVKRDRRPARKAG